MITYAQNFEDVILARAFGDRSDGFYIDIGACYPDVASVTRHFYEAGWSGVNVEPMPEPFARLAAARPRDVNLRLAIAGHRGEIDLYEGPSVGETSAVRPHEAARATRVPCTTLAELCEEHASRAIDFLKIDVEGLEREVVAGGDWTRFRPVVVVVEVTLPWSTTRRPDSADIASILGAARYREVYFDGINAFFLAGEAEHLAARFACPPNVLDGFRTAQEASLAGAVDAVSRQAEQHAQAVAAAEARTRQAETAMAAAVHAQHEATLLLQAALARSSDEEVLRAALRAALRDKAALEDEVARAKDASSELVHKFAEAEQARSAAEAAALVERRAREAEREHGLALERRLAEAVQSAQGADRRADEATARADAADARAEDIARASDARASAAEQLARVAEARAEQAETRTAHAEFRAVHAESAFRSIEQSRSWRLTSPLRHLRALLRPRASRPAGANPVPSASVGLPTPRQSLRAAVAGGVALARRLGVYAALASWLRRRHPAVWARAKQVMLDAPTPPVVPLRAFPAAVEQPPAPVAAIPAPAAFDDALVDAPDVSLDVVRHCLRAEVGRRSA